MCIYIIYLYVNVKINANPPVAWSCTNFDPYASCFRTKLSCMKRTPCGIISGWWFAPLWKIWKSVGMIIPNIWKNKTCSKPPTRYIMLIIMLYIYIRRTNIPRTWSFCSPISRYILAIFLNSIYFSTGSRQTSRTLSNPPDLTTRSLGLFGWVLRLSTFKKHLYWLVVQ